MLTQHQPRWEARFLQLSRHFSQKCRFQHDSCEKAGFSAELAPKEDARPQKPAESQEFLKNSQGWMQIPAYLQVWMTANQIDLSAPHPHPRQPHSARSPGRQDCEGFLCRGFLAEILFHIEL
ncbi:hypothetical protein ABE504_17140 [Paenibacillus oryzisoli]|uniref:hypothetical protein n=1 Tax=Paenibacillus oryzisoli TaxID=1850517 RepID=UPI003D2AF256